jgi:hypothetical protein
VYVHVIGSSMADSQVLAVYEDFSGGHYSPGSVGVPMPDGTYTGTNVITHTNGVVIPRRGITTLTSSNSLGSEIPDMCGRGGNNDLYFASDAEAFYQWDTNLAGSAASRYGATDQLGALFVDNKMYFATSGANGLWTWDGTTATNVSASIAGTCLAVFNDRLYVGGDLTGTGYRLYWSEPADYDNFPAQNFLDIPPAFSRIQCLESFGGQLVIATQNSISEIPRWWALTGNPKEGGSLQEIGNGPYVYDYKGVAKISEGIIVAAADGIFIFRGGRQFERVDNVFVSHPLVLQGPGGGSIAVSEDGYSCVIADSVNNYIFHYNGHTRRWTRHRPASAVVNLQSGHGKRVCPNGPSTWAFFRDEANTGSGPYNLAHQLDMRDDLFPSSPQVDTVDGSSTEITCSLILPPVYAPTGQSFTVRSIDIEYYYLNGTYSMSGLIYTAFTSLAGGIPSQPNFVSFTVPGALGSGFQSTTVPAAGVKGKLIQPSLSFSNNAIQRVVVRGTIERDMDAR